MMGGFNLAWWLLALGAHPTALLLFCLVVVLDGVDALGTRFDAQLVDDVQAGGTINFKMSCMSGTTCWTHI